MQALFYTFTKRINSTVQPAAFLPHGTYDIILKEDSGLLQPEIFLKWTGSGNPCAYNYVHIPVFGRYYWISNWTYSERQWGASLSVDVLASWRSYIGQTEKYVLRAYQDYDRTVIDTMYPATSEETDYTASQYMFVPANPLNSGSFILNVSGAAPNTTGIGGCGFYVCSGAEISDIVNNAFTTVSTLVNGAPQQSGNWLEDIMIWLGNLFIKGTDDVSRFINSITWVPVPAANIQAAGTVHVFLGLVDCGTAHPLGNPLYSATLDYDVSGWTTGSGDWEDLEPYAHYTMESIPFGVIPLDSVAVLRYKQIKARFTMDVVSGIANLRITAGSGTNYYLLAQRSAQIGLPVEIGGYHVNYAGALTNLITTGANAALGAASGLPVLGSVLNGLGNAVNNLIPDPVSGGRSGGAAAADGTLTLHLKKLSHVDQDPIENGRPLCRVEMISNLTGGYVLCRDGDIEAPCTDGELEQISQYLTGGFFYE